ncbi:ABC transporter permease [Mucilaginibacter mali]|uniref:ABC transporter permease n=1 Tax=Mucilaginibacter mali TaxID=2740462 RepID=A0A7D4QAY4_9SPHI|nr:ABC transporter permease [Mucilaginibacter mali]QKJ31185.1 ABC transporter permease [Mucilaginibacter mali]
MILNYFKIAWRNLVRNKTNTIINLTGLAIGLACSLLMLLWVQSELNVDAGHANGAYLYKVYEREYLDGKVEGDYDTPGLMADLLKKDIPEVQYAAGLEEGNDSFTFRSANKVLKMEGTYAGADFFRMFSYPLLQGTAQTALNTPAGIAISKKMAGIFFGTPAAAMGKTLRFENRKDLVVTAVFDNLPANASRTFDYLINWQQFVADYPGVKNFGNSGELTFVQLRPDADLARVNKKLKNVLEPYAPHKGDFRVEHYLQRFDEAYLHAHFTNGQVDGGRIAYVHLFSIVAIFVLLIACVNFMNLTTAQSVKRAREIGVRKVMGAVRGVLIRQFIGESLMLTTLAVIAALLLMVMVLPVFNQVTQKQIVLPFSDWIFWSKLIVLTLVTGLIAGSYPALFLSSFNPVKVLKGVLKIGQSAIWFRKGLVVFQFVLSSVLIIATIVVSKQVNYIQTTNIGYDKENLVYVPIEGDLGKNYEAFKNAALNMPGIASVSKMGTSPSFIDDGTTNIDWEDKNPNATVSFAFAAVGYDFIRTMKGSLIAGRDFSTSYPSDSVNYIINETALAKIGYTDPIGRTFTQWGVKGKIIGVVKDFHFESLHTRIRPMVIRLMETRRGDGYILARIKPGQTPAALAGIKSLCAKLNPAFPFSYTFSDQAYLKLYQSEAVVGTLSNGFAILAVFISCLGLLGLAMFTAQQRVKELGIRKVLGASVASLFKLMSGEFLALVAVALLVATPLAWYCVHVWLQGFAYQTPVPWWIFGLAAILMLGIALLTVSLQAIKAALVNPVKSLRSE